MADVAKPVVPARRTTSKAHRIALDDDGAFIRHKATGKNSTSDKKGNVFVARTTILPPEEETTPHDKEGAHAVGELGFPRQEED